ncbi:MAG TPA: ParB/RepB/Spo0J family partition protein [Dehalococcoidia bacterium]|nr:ParB/RepB/Spo0J family partition protein [Dehalococcoidia bacterium]
MNAGPGRPARGLGRGLAALLPGGPEAAHEVDIDLIAPNPEQPRKQLDAQSLQELAESIRQHGILQPLIVSRHLATGGGASYALIAGQRRLQAARLAGLTRVPVVVREIQDVQRLELALVENLQRADLSPLDEAAAFRRLIDEFGLTQEEVARRVGRGRVAVANSLRLLGLSPLIRSSLASGEISAGHARALLGAGLETDRAHLLGQIVQQGLSVRQTEVLVRGLRIAGVPPRERSIRAPDPERVALEERLRSALATQVEIRPSRRGGRILIRYYNEDDLQEILDVLLRGREANAGAAK